MRYLGIDFGAKRLGVAVSDAKGEFAFPRNTILHDKKAVATIVDLARKEGVSCVVIGNTRSLAGDENEITAALERFIPQLEAAGLTVDRIWEGWSSHEAARFAPKGKTHDDAAAAAIILQRYLEMHASKVE
jgi:putative Holliday junction resolvase